MAAQLKSWVSGMQLIYPNIQRLSPHNLIFIWPQDLEKEFQAMKKAMQYAVKLSQIDTKKRLNAFVDSAVTVGTAYILAQRQDEKKESKGYNILLVDSTTFKRAQVQYSHLKQNHLGFFGS